MLIYLTMIDSPEDQDRFIEIYNHYKDYLQHLALEILHNFDDAEDAVQETFFYVAKNLNKIRESSSPQTTVFLSAANKSRSPGSPPMAVTSALSSSSVMNFANDDL